MGAPEGLGEIQIFGKSVLSSWFSSSFHLILPGIGPVYKLHALSAGRPISTSLSLLKIIILPLIYY